MNTKTGLDVLECEIAQIEATVYTLKRCLQDLRYSIENSEVEEYKMDEEVVYRHIVEYLKLKIAEAELYKNGYFEITKVGNEDDYLEHKIFSGRLEAFKEVLNEIDEYCDKGDKKDG
jgi:hypothetical protein